MLETGGFGGPQDSAAVVRVSNFGHGMSFHGSNRPRRIPGSQGMGVDAQDLDRSGNDDIVNVSGTQGRNAAVVLYSASNNRPEHQSLRVGEPGHNASDKSIAAATHASGGTGGLNPGQPLNYQDPFKDSKGLVARLGSKSKS